MLALLSVVGSCPVVLHLCFRFSIFFARNLFLIFLNRHISHATSVILLPFNESADEQKLAKDLFSDIRCENVVFLVLGRKIPVGNCFNILDALHE